MKKYIILALLIFITAQLFSQDTLPKFTLADRGERVTISWKNPYQKLVQLNIQRSYDSLRNFATVYSATSPELPQNGYTDVKPAYNRVFYRIFYVLEGGSYFFTHSQRASGYSFPNAVTTPASTTNTNSRDLTNNRFSIVQPGDKRMVSIKIKDTIYRQVSVNAFHNFRDSILRQTKDTLYSINDTLVGLNPFIVKEVYRTSSYVYINKDGFINVTVPVANEKKYSLKFFEEDGTSLFEIHLVRESPLILDKANFVHAGWFLFELFEDNKLKEKNKLYVPKDF